MTHRMTLQPTPFARIANGTKTFELRLNDEKRQRLRTGDHIVFTKADDPTTTLRVTVIALHLFSSFEELYRTLPLGKCGYSQDELPTASPDDMTVYYSKVEQARHGVLGIEVALINNV